MDVVFQHIQYLKAHEDQGRTLVGCTMQLSCSHTQADGVFDRSLLAVLSENMMIYSFIKQDWAII